jgi:hypothetical protein
MRVIHHLFKHSDGLELDCTLEYEKGQRATLTDPAFPPQAYLMSAKVGGVDIMPLLSDALIATIEESAIWSLE